MVTITDFMELFEQSKMAGENAHYWPCARYVFLHKFKFKNQNILGSTIIDLL